MIDALIAGRLYAKPQSRMDKRDKPYALARLRVVLGESWTVVNVIALYEAPARALLALNEGDSVAISGELKIKVFLDKSGEPKPSLDMVAHAVLTPYHAHQRREAMAERLEADA